MAEATAAGTPADELRGGRTVLNRLVERGLLVRERSGRAFVYRPKVDEAEYVARSIGERR